ncbi:CLIP domain-containing serine protease HP8 isoform X2 [Aethina tumida]|uniref:CLIP domain-containing serine protease HP8 isoform X2 n=1 Tax=Aethina tumida TaxID=116153 RepID=UPI002148BFF7|nr:CLIP domain-containing serine protease HP8 isoform X2 [Aethina tumida]
MKLTNKMFSVITILLHLRLTAGQIIDSKCEPPRGDTCIDIYQCPFFADLLKKSPKPRPLSIIKMIRSHQCGLIGRKVPKVCCTMQAKNGETLTEHSWKSNGLMSHRNFDLLPHKTCGPMSGSSRIIRGNKASIGEFPWMALIIYNTDQRLDFKCGGTVITERYVLSAAHCKLKSAIGVRLGEYDVDKVIDCEDGYCAPAPQDFYIESFVVHPGYDPKTFVNDIGIIKLLTPANFGDPNVQPICLPSDEAANADLVGTQPVVTGWGVTEDGTKSSKLLKVQIPIVPTSECRKVYSHFAPISEKQVCAGGVDGKDSCGGDSGGPMQYLGSMGGRLAFIQHGIVSYGPRDCGTVGQPAIYTRVDSYMEWILDNLDP